MIKTEYCPHEKKDTRHLIEKFDTGKQIDTSKKCLSCGLFRHFSSKTEKLLYKQMLELHPSKKYRGFNVDKGLDTRILNSINANRNIKVISVCTGHKYAVEPYSEVHHYPEVIFCSTKKINMPKIKDTKINTEKISNVSGICYRLKGKSNTKEWWNNIEKIVSNIGKHEHT